MGSTVYSESASGDTTGSAYPLLTANATFSGQLDPARLVTSPYSGYQSDRDYFGIPIGAAGVQPGRTLRFTVAGLPASANFAASYTYVSPGAKPDFSSNVQTAIVGSAGIIDVPANVDPNAVLVLSLGDDNGASYGYSVAWSDGSASSPPTSPLPAPVVTDPTPSPIALPEPVGTTTSGDPVYDLGIGIANAAPVQPQLPRRPSLRRAIRALLDVDLSEPSPGSGSISLDSWGANGETVGSYDGPGSFPEDLDLPEGTSTFSASGIVDQTGERVDLQLPTTITTGIVDEPYATRITTDDVLANYLDSGKDVEHNLYYTNRGELYARGTTTRIVDTGATMEEFDFSDLRDEGKRLLETSQYDGAGTLLTTETSFRNGTTSASSSAAGQTLTAGHAATLTGNGVGQTDFVFTPGFGTAKVTDFLYAGPDHDTLELPSADFAGLADALAHTTMRNGSAVIIDPVSHDRIRLEHVTKGQLQRHPDVFAFA